MYMGMQGSHYFQIRERSDFYFKDILGKSGKAKRRLMGVVNCV